MAQVAVIGAGIAGLTAAYRLHRLGLEVTILEASERIGGLMYTERLQGFLVEHGPNSIQSAGDALGRLLDELGLDEKRVLPSEAAQTRFIVRDGEPKSAPASPSKLLTTDLFGSASKLRLLREPFIPASDPAVEESVADFIRRRLGNELLEYAMEPFVAGVHAGDAERLSVRHAFPRLYEMEQASGSIIKGQIDMKRSSAASAVETHRMFSFEQGLGQLPNAIGHALGDRIRTGRPVRRIERRDSKWKVGESDEDRSFDAVIYAAPLHALSDIDLPGGPSVAPLTGVTYAPLSVIALGFRREHVLHPLDGFGMLLPRKENDYRILGTLFTSSIFPGRAPEGHVLLTTFVGGMRHPRLATAPDTDVFDIVHHDLRELLSVTGAPVLRKRIVWKQAIPQYQIGYHRVFEAVDRLEQQWPGWFMAGSYRQGVSVGDSAGSGEEAALRCAGYLSA